jgi:hypothetical protein
MSGAAALVSYDDFSAGEYGLTGSWRAPKGSFTGLNVTPYDDGSIGPRAGLKAYTLTSMPAGDTLAMGYGKTTAGQLRIWFVKGTAVYSFVATNFASQAVVAYTGALTTAPRASASVSFVHKQGATYWLNHADGKLWKLNHDTNTVSAAPAAAIVTADANSHAVVCQYGARTMAATNFSNRVFFSDADNPESWPAANYFDVGETLMGITGLHAQRNHLSIAKGLDGHLGEWWVLTGVPGVDSALRRQQVGASPIPAGSAVVDGDGIVHFGENFSSTPAAFTGSQIVMREDLAEPDGRTFSAATATRRPGDVVLAANPSGNAEVRLTQRRGRAWLRHRLEAGPSGYALAKAHMASYPLYDLHVVCVDDRSDFRSWSAYANSPAAGAYSGVLSPASPDLCAFTLPEWWAPDGREVSVRAVQVDFRSFAVGSGNCTWTLALTPRRVHEGGDGAAKTFAFSEAAPGASVNRRRQALFSIEDANGFTLAFSNLRGVAIQKVTVLGTARPAQGLA